MKLTTLWVVRDPTPNSELLDILFETTSDKLALYILGCPSPSSWAEENHTIYTTEAEARIDAIQRMGRLAPAPVHTAFNRHGRKVRVTIPGRLALQTVYTQIMSKSPSIARCSFCNRPRNEVKSLIAARDEGPFICNRCLKQSWEAIQVAEVQQNAKREEPLRKPAEIKTLFDQHVISQDKAKTDIAVAVYNHYKRREAAKKGGNAEGVEIQKSNILLMGPSGTGKTEIARSVARMLNVPLHIGDATRLTQAGYVGDDVESLLQGLIQAADGDIERAQWGIIFIDEIDKLARKSGRGATGYRDVTGEGVQQALLKLLEGSKVVVPRGVNKMQMDGADVIDTSNILFIGAGSFAGIEEIVERRLNKGAGLGFGTSERRKVEKSEVYLNMTEDDVLDFGMIPEVMGRLPVLTTTLDLTDDEMVRILTEPKNAIVKQFRALFEMDGIDLQIDEGALKAIGREAKKRPTGARALRSILEAVLRPYAYELPSDPTVKVLRITEDVVNGTAKALVVREPKGRKATAGQG